jgi:hypothetical protein
MDDAVVPRSAADWRDELDTLLWIREERHATKLGMRLAARVVAEPSGEIVIALKWLFRGWKIASIAKCVEALQIGERMVQVLSGVMEGWSVKHMAELLVLLYFRGDQPAANRRNVWEILVLLPRTKALEIIDLIQILTNCAPINDM